MNKSLDATKKVLCVEDHKDYLELISESLKEFHIVQATSIKSAKQLIERLEHFDCVILDLSLPDGDGFRVFTELRARSEYVNTPVIFLTHSDELEDKIAAFQLGAADYLTKPIHPLELKTRVHARLRHAETKSEAETTLMVGDLKLCLNDQTTYKKSNGNWLFLDLTAREWKLLIYFAQNKKKTLSREEILIHLWPNSHVADRTIDTHVSNLRKKLSTDYIEIRPVPGLGYKMIENGEE